MSATTISEGVCAPRFRAVRECFEEGFRSRNEIGAALAISLDGETVVDLWGGHADQARHTPWRRDTLVNLYSTTKGMTALCAHQLVDRGKLDLDAPVARYWPEFAQAGKGDIPLRWLLSHRAGLPAVSEPLASEALYDWDAMTTALARQEPWWQPGEKHGYHALTFGWLVGEVVRRVTGRSLGAYFRDEIASPLGLDLHIGLAEKEHARVAEMSPLPLPDADSEGLSLAQILSKDPEGMVAKSFLNPPSMMAGPNHAAWRKAEIPAANGHGSARDLSRVYGALSCGGSMDGVHVLTSESIEGCRSEQSSGPDAVLQLPTRFGLGFMLSQPVPGGAFGPHSGAFGHPGAGGSVGFADPEARIGFGYVMNRMGPHILLDPRVTVLIDALYESLD